MTAESYGSRAGFPFESTISRVWLWGSMRVAWVSVSTVMPVAARSAALRWAKLVQWVTSPEM